jgi:dipeptidyl aminopeptidase/acylaminoacyl peptidase
MDALIDRTTLFGNPERTQTRISPDGRWLSWLAPVDGITNVFVAPVDAPEQARAITDDRTRDIRMHAWAHSSRRVLYIQDAGGDENWHVFAADPATGDVLDLTPGDGLNAQLLEASSAHPDHIVIGLNDREPALHDWYRVHVETGDRERLLENPGYVSGVFDHDLVPRLGIAMQPDGSLAVLRLADEGPTPLFVIGPDDNLTTSPIGYDHAGETLYLLDSRARDTGALVAMDVATGTTTVLFEDPGADVADVWVDPATGRVQAAVSNRHRERIEVLDETVRADVERLTAWCDGELAVTARTADDRRWVVAYTRDVGALRYALYDRDAATVTHLWDHRPELADVPLTRMHPSTITARDGLEMVAYLSLPRWCDEDGRPPEPLPMVLLVHGGPWARTSWGLDAQTQLLANRGYAVLAVNFRGSTGFGKRFVNAGDKAWAGAMHDDLLDAVEWAVEHGIADRERVAIMGGSYGGYATLVGLTFTPDVFACGVDIVGPSNLITLLETIPPYWAPMIAQFHRRLGRADTEGGRADLWARSPLSKVEHIRKPLLIGQGANDPRVKQAESDQIVAAMKERGIPVTYVLFPDEGHGFAGHDNRLAFQALTESFLAEHLGGRAQPVGDQVARSTAIVDG